MLMLLLLPISRIEVAHSNRHQNSINLVCRSDGCNRSLSRKFRQNPYWFKNHTLLHQKLKPRPLKYNKDIKMLLSVDGGEILDHNLSASSLGTLSRRHKKKLLSYETNSEANDKAVQLISR